MTDADVDGAHIRTLLLTLFYRYFPELIYTGHLYIAQPPLYSVKRGKEFIWLFSDAELEAYKKKNKISDDSITISEEEQAPPESDQPVEKKDKLSVQRYKGLGEMNPEQLWTTTMDPETRILKQVTIDDATKADEIFDILMGSDVAPRKQFIHAHAQNVKNLDI